MTNDSENTKERCKNLPIDRGWAWMILLGTAVINLFLLGTMKSFGLFFVAYIEKYECSVTVATLILAMYIVVFIFVSTPLLTVGLQNTSIRKICMTGAFLYSLGTGLSSFAPNIIVLVIFQSVFCGSAHAMLMPPTIVLLGNYFKKRRGLANGLAFSWVSLGGLVMPNLYRYLLDEYGLEGALIVTSGLTLHMLVAASLFRPLIFYDRRKTVAVDSLAGSKALIEEIDNSDVLKYVGNTNLNCKDETDASTELLPSSDVSKMGTIISSKKGSHISEPLQSSIENNFAIQSDFSGSVVSLYLAKEDNSQTKEETQKYNFSNHLSNWSKCKKYGIKYLNVLRNKELLIFIVVYALGTTATANMSTFIPHHAKQLGIDKTRAALLVSIIGITDFLGRILCGFLADRKCISKVYIILISQFIICIILYLSFLYRQFWEMVLFVGILGFVIGMIVALFAPVTIDIIGTEEFATAIAVIFLLQAIFHGVSVVILGYLRDVTGNYLASFYYLGSTSLLAVILLLIKPVTKKSRYCRSSNMKGQKTEN